MICFSGLLIKMEASEKNESMHSGKRMYAIDLYRVMTGWAPSCFRGAPGQLGAFLATRVEASVLLVSHKGSHGLAPQE